MTVLAFIILFGYFSATLAAASGGKTNSSAFRFVATVIALAAITLSIWVIAA